MANLSDQSLAAALSIGELNTEQQFISVMCLLLLLLLLLSKVSCLLWWTV